MNVFNISNEYQLNRQVMNPYRQAKQNLCMEQTHSGIYSIQGLLFLQKDSMSEYEQLFGTAWIFVPKITSIWNYFVWSCVLFVLNSVNVSEENEKLMRTTYKTLKYTAMKDTLKKVFSGISLMKSKTFSTIELKQWISVGTKVAGNKKLIGEIRQISKIDKVR